MTKKIGFIGAGKVGFSLGRHISERAYGFKVCGYYSRSPESAREAAAFAGGSAFGTMEELAGECDLLFLTVPDGQIADVWAQLLPALTDSKHGRALYIAHCSGSQDSRIFTPRPDAEPYLCAGAGTGELTVPAHLYFGSLHPLLAVHDKTTAYENLADAYFTVEGDPAFTEIAGALMTSLGNPFCKIEAEQKTLYHAASVMVSNLVCALAYEGMEVFKACGLDAGFAESAWRALFLGNAENIAALGPVSALTGPIERGDTATVAKHLDALTGDTKEIYLLLSRALTETAQRKNPERDYSELKVLLG